MTTKVAHWDWDWVRRVSLPMFAKGQGADLVQTCPQQRALLTIAAHIEV